MTAIGFTGTRKGMTTEQNIAFRLILPLPDDWHHFHHGDCIGADAQAHDIAKAAGWSVCIHPPKNGQWRAYCKLDPLPDDGAWDSLDMHDHMMPEENFLRRNRDIVDTCDRLIACPKEMTGAPGTGGTWYTVRYAQHMGKPVTIVWPDGTVT